MPNVSVISAGYVRGVIVAVTLSRVEVEFMKAIQVPRFSGFALVAMAAALALMTGALGGHRPTALAGSLDGTRFLWLD